MNKVLVIAPYNYLPYFSGGQKFIAQFAESLAKEADLTVVTVAENDFSLAKGYKTIPLLKKGFSRYYDRSLVKKIAAIITEGNFDTIIWEHPYFGWLAKIIKKRTGIQTIIHTHNIEHQRFRSTAKWWWPLLKFYERRVFRSADKIFFITPEDREFAVKKWKIAKEKCVDVPFGIGINEFPDDRSACRQKINQVYNIRQEEKVFLFNGLLDYKPNLDALMVILDEINPLLLQSTLRYKIIITGKRLPSRLNGLKDYADKNVIYAGFVDDVETYFKAANIFLNPVQSGGGIKTKMVEAIGYGATVVATETAATGMDREVCGDKLIVVTDNAWKDFTTAVIENSERAVTTITPSSYYQYYSWPNIIKRILAEV